MLRFRRLSTSALESVRRTVDEDAAFRARVAAVADEAIEDIVGEAGRLFLTRPEGWVEALRRLEDDADAAATAAVDAGAERSARKRLRLVEEAADRAEERVRTLKAELATARTELTEERRARQRAEEEAANAAGRVHGLERERDAAHRRVAATEANLVRLQRELDDARARQAPDPAADPAAPAPAAATAFDADALRAAIADARAAAAVLRRSLDAAAQGLGDEPGRGPSDRRARTAPPTPPRRPTGRLPVALPPGLFDDDPAAADHLVRVRGCVLVVDGYNASLRRWPDLPIAEQRRRLVDAVAGLAARCGTDVHIVFDGDDETGRRMALARRGVQVSFSAREVEADAVILERVERLPDTCPVVVATDDRRVRREAAARGANVITQEQLFGVL